MHYFTSPEGLVARESVGGGGGGQRDVGNYDMSGF